MSFWCVIFRVQNINDLAKKCELFSNFKREIDDIIWRLFSSNSNNINDSHTQYSTTGRCLIFDWGVKQTTTSPELIFIPFPFIATVLIRVRTMYFNSKQIIASISVFVCSDPFYVDHIIIVQREKMNKK